MQQHLVVHRLRGRLGWNAWVVASVVTAACIPTALAIIPAPAIPLPASGTCKDGYVWRLINPNDKTCVTNLIAKETLGPSHPSYQPPMPNPHSNVV